jgi:hypothetical protein
VIVDAHHHLWQLSGGPLHYPWLQDPEPHEFFLGDYATLKRDYLPADYRRDAAGLGVVRTVHVEAECSREQQVAETEWLTALHAKEGMPNAIVAHAWFHTPEAAQVLERQASFPLVRGIRSKPFRDGMMRDKAWLAGYALLERFKLSWDCRVKTWELEEAAVVVRSLVRCPTMDPPPPPPPHPDLRRGARRFGSGCGSGCGCGDGDADHPSRRARQSLASIATIRSSSCSPRSVLRRSPASLFSAGSQPTSLLTPRRGSRSGRATGRPQELGQERAPRSPGPFSSTMMDTSSDSVAVELARLLEDEVAVL